MIREEEISMYGPVNGTDLIKQYPELLEVEEFAGISTKKLLLTWYYANSTSPLFGQSEEEKIRNSFLNAYESEDKIPEQEMDAWLSGEFTKEEMAAIKKWKSMDKNIRNKARIMVDKMMENLSKMIEVSDSDFKKFDDEGNEIKGVDWQARNQYANCCKTVSALLPELIVQMEQGFGIRTKGKDTSKKQSGESAIDRYHKRNKKTS